MSRILVLRPEPGASVSVRRARELGLDAVAIPLFEIEPVAWSRPDPARFDGLLLTSANAIRQAGDGLNELRGLKAYAVGEATAEAARAAGFDVAAKGDSGVCRLLGSIEPDLRLLHLCGADRREPDAPRQSITAVPVYRAKAVEQADLGGVEESIALVHSPRAARRLAELVKDRASVTIVAISQAAADAAGAGWKEIAVADQAADEAMLALAAGLCNKPHPQ